MRALIILLPIEGSLAQNGTRPHFRVRSWRSEGPVLSSDDCGRWTTAYTCLVGATL